MLRLENVDIKEFKKTIYPEYKKIFPAIERKPYRTLERGFYNNITQIIKVTADNTFIGFIIANSVKNNKYLQVDYLAILPQYQNKGYGTKILELLKEQYKEYAGIYIEVEKMGLGKDEEENRQRKRRKEFYERAGFKKLDFDLELFTVIYTPYVLQISGKLDTREQIIKDIFEIYNATTKEKRVKKYCKVIIE